MPDGLHICKISDFGISKINLIRESTQSMNMLNSKKTETDNETITIPATTPMIAAPEIKINYGSY